VDNWRTSALRPVAQYKALPMEASSSNIGSEERDEVKGAERVEEPSTVHLIRGDSRLPAMTASPDQVRRRGRRPPALIRMGRSDPHFSESWMAALLLRPKPLNAWVRRDASRSCCRRRKSSNFQREHIHCILHDPPTSFHDTPLPLYSQLRSSPWIDALRIR
jgi:hypothetical protein